MNQALPQWAYSEADKRARKRHGDACQCLRCIGPDAYKAETARLKAENDARNTARGRGNPEGLWSQLSSEYHQRWRGQFRAKYSGGRQRV